MLLSCFFGLFVSWIVGVLFGWIVKMNCMNGLLLVSSFMILVVFSFRWCLIGNSVLIVVLVFLDVLGLIRMVLLLVFLVNVMVIFCVFWL